MTTNTSEPTTNELATNELAQLAIEQIDEIEQADVHVNHDLRVVVFEAVDITQLNELVNYINTFTSVNSMVATNGSDEPMRLDAQLTIEDVTYNERRAPNYVVHVEDIAYVDADGDVIEAEMETDA